MFNAVVVILSNLCSEAPTTVNALRNTNKGILENEYTAPLDSVATTQMTHPEVVWRSCRTPVMSAKTMRGSTSSVKASIISSPGYPVHNANKLQHTCLLMQHVVHASLLSALTCLGKYNV